jgi:hypothetical protein
MISRFLRFTVLLAVVAITLAQTAARPEPEPESTRLPGGKNQQDEILKAQHQQNLKDAAQLVELSGLLKEEIEKNDRYVLSISSLKKIDEIEKLTKRLRARLHR